MLQDREFTCKECGATFVFTVGEQEFYLARGLRHAPQRCAACRRTASAGNGQSAALPARSRNGTGGKSKWTRRQMTEIRCAQCGEVTTVPWQARGDQPVFCGRCYAEARGSMGSESR